MGLYTLMAGLPNAMSSAVQAGDLLLSTKDKKVCVLLDTVDYSGNEENSFQVEAGRPQSDSASPVIAEIQALYQLPSGVHA